MNISFLGGVQLTAMHIIGEYEYMAHLSAEVRQHLLYIIAESNTQVPVLLRNKQA
jgi:hypothetical protein